MRSLVFVWPYAVLFWVIYVWVFTPEFAIVRRAQKTVTEKDAGSMRVVTQGMGIAMLLAYPISFIKPLRFPASWTMPAFWIGTALLVAGSLLRRHCWRVLGEWFTGDVQVRAEQPIIDRGAYRWVRHPAYTGGILMNIGIGIALANWLSFALVTIVAIAVYSYRVTVEERALCETLGDTYRTYMRTRKRFVPYVY